LGPAADPPMTIILLFFISMFTSHSFDCPPPARHGVLRVEYHPDPRRH
jgi:hypothetical protein